MEDITSASMSDDDYITRYHGLMHKLRANGALTQLYLQLDNIDQKTSALLTHVSIMIAVASIFFSEARSTVFLKWIIGFEIMVYMTIAIACLTCVSILTPSRKITTEKQLISTARRAFNYRINIYRSCLFITIIATICLIVTFVIEIFYG